MKSKKLRGILINNMGKASNEANNGLASEISDDETP